MAYGSPVVFKQARFVRIADHADELRDNRRGESVADRRRWMRWHRRSITPSAALDTAWTGGARAEHVKRSRGKARMRASAVAPAGKDGHMHPNRIFAALREVLAPTRSRSPTAATC